MVIAVRKNRLSKFLRISVFEISNIKAHQSHINKIPHLSNFCEKIVLKI